MQPNLQQSTVVPMSMDGVQVGKPGVGGMRLPNTLQLNAGNLPQMTMMQQANHGNVFQGMNIQPGLGNPNMGVHQNSPGNQHMPGNVNMAGNQNPNIGGHNMGIMPGMMVNPSGIDNLSGSNLLVQNNLMGINPSNPGPTLDQALADQPSKLQDQRLIWAGDVSSPSMFINRNFILILTISLHHTLVRHIYAHMLNNFVVYGAFIWKARISYIQFQHRVKVSMMSHVDMCV